MKFDSIIFDLDGTLIDSSDGVVEAVNYSLEQLGVPKQPPEVIKTYIGYPLEYMYPNFTDKPFAELREHFRVRAAETVVSSTNALPGSDDVIRTLVKSNLALGIATTKIRSHLDGIIAKMNWAEYFRGLAGGDEVKNVKPKPDIIELVIDRMNVTGHDTLMVGDTINDVLAARAAGLKVAAVASPYGRHDELKDSNPDFFLESLSELPALVNRKIC